MERFETQIDGRLLSVEIGRVAKQADGSCWIRLGDTVSMATACASDKPDFSKGYFPLSVDYREKSYAAGKIPGGFFKREGRPSEKEILSARLIDRPLRPLFPKDYGNEVQIMVSTLSSDQENDADVLGIIGASIALNNSSIPFTELLAAVRVGRVHGELVIFPTFSQLEESDLNLVLAGTPDHIVMVEGGCNEVSEEGMLEALAFGQEHIWQVCKLIDEIRQKVAKPKQPVIPPDVPAEHAGKVRELAAARIIAANDLIEKAEHHDVMAKVREDVLTALKEQYGDYEVFTKACIEELEAEDLRRRVMSTRKRVDGREPDSVRSISCEISVLPRTHGSALFTRGQTQALVVATLGTKIDEQRVDALEGESTKSYMLHYNFPPYSVGEVRPARGPGRREIGHGALAERSLAAVLPQETDFPYTIRVVSDVLESNGSSSMATVCGGTLALMDAGVPIKAPVAGIAMGLVMENGNYLILTDIMGAEDHFGDMDFKVAGTRNGITAFQLDIKIGGLTMQIMREALEKARVARVKILDIMQQTIAEPRADISMYAPRIIIIKVKQDKIGEIIGPGGKMIRSIIEATGAKIDIDDDGTVLIASVEAEAGLKAKAMIEALIEEPEVGKIYEGKVKRIAEFGAFVEILPNTDGLLHVSEIAYERVNRVEDYMRLGDQFPVKVLSIDEDGKIRLSKKALQPRPEGYEPRAESEDGGHHRRSGPGRPGPRRRERN